MCCGSDSVGEWWKESKGSHATHCLEKCNVSCILLRRRVNREKDNVVPLKCTPNLGMGLS